MRHAIRLFTFSYAVLLLIALASCMGRVSAPEQPSHNAAGGYIDACGELPGLVGDDC
jgi:hypothetical protein